MSFFNNNPLNSNGALNPVQPSDIPKVYEYTELGTIVNQEYWRVMHPNFRRTVDKALIYLNGTLVDESAWSIVTREDGDYAYIPFTPVPEQTLPPYLHVVVITNGFGS